MSTYTATVNCDSYDLFQALNLKVRISFTTIYINDRLTLLPETRGKECLAQCQGHT